MAQLAQRLGFNLANTLTRHVVAIADFLERKARAIHQAKAHFENRALPLTQQGQDALKLFFEQALAGCSGRVFSVFVLDEVAHSHFAILSHGRVQRDGLPGYAEQCFDAVDWHVHLFGEVFGGRFAAQFLAELFLRSHELGHEFHHVHRKTDGAGLVGDLTRHRLANPPHRISGELICPRFQCLANRSRDFVDRRGVIARRSHLHHAGAQVRHAVTGLGQL